MAALIQDIEAREILDCRGIPTVEATLWLDNGLYATTSVPTGTSVAPHEALELRDNDPQRFGGLGVQKAVANINQQIAPRIRGLDPTKQGEIDALLLKLDGTENKKNLGANTLLAVSQAVCKVAAALYNLPVYNYLHLKYQLNGDTIVLPTPSFNMINGGKQGAGNLDFQEFLVVPSSRFSMSEAIQIGVEVYYAIERTLISKNAIHSVGVEGGFAPNLFTNLDALEIMTLAIKNTLYQYGHDIFFGLDVAATGLHRNGKYMIKDKSQGYSAKEMIEYYVDMNDQYHLFYLEDALEEDDFSSWHKLTEELGDQVLIVADNLITSNKKRLHKALSEQACNALVIKPNQLGTITETVEIAGLAKQAGMSLVVSNRSGETTDTFIVDFAVGVGADYVKFGAPNRGERTAKYNRLMGIEKDLLEKQYAENQQQSPNSGEQQVATQES